jgi:hypothetical protein
MSMQVWVLKQVYGHVTVNTWANIRGALGLTGLWGVACVGTDSEGGWPLTPPFLAEFPQHVLGMSQLQCLSLVSRGLTAIPEGISRLNQLTQLQIRWEGKAHVASHEKLPPSFSLCVLLKNQGLQMLFYGYLDAHIDCARKHDVSGNTLQCQVVKARGR